RYFPDVVWRELLIILVVIVVIMVLAVVVGPRPLGAQPDPTNVAVSPRPDWYLLPVFALLAVVPFRVEDLLIVFGPIVVGTALILMPFVAGGGERSPWRRPWAVALALTLVLGVTSLTYVGLRAPWSPRFDTRP